MSDTHDLWAAVDQLTKPSTVRVTRHGFEWVDEHGRNLPPAIYQAATTGWATVPSLWDQSTVALHGRDGEVGVGAGPLRERTIADLDLMEIRSIIRDTTRAELYVRGVEPPRQVDGSYVAFTPGEIRALAVLILPDADDLWWWVYRFGQWARLLDTYLGQAERRPHRVRLRNTACPKCAARQVLDGVGDDAVVVPALVIDFTQDGYARACECLRCGFTAWRGEDMERLAREVAG